MREGRERQWRGGGRKRESNEWRGREMIGEREKERVGRIERTGESGRAAGRETGRENDRDRGR